MVHWAVKIVLIALLVFGVGYFLLQYVEYRRNTMLLGASLKLINMGEYEEGIGECDKMTYAHNVCYMTTMILKEIRNESLSREFCEEIPEHSGYPWWMGSERARKDQELALARSDCFERVRD